jgi:hypothetical protein
LDLIGSAFGSSNFGSSRVIRVRVGSGFRFSDFGSSRVSDCLGFELGQISNHLISSFRSSGFGSGRVSGTLISGCLGFQVISGRVGSDSDQFNFLKKSSRIKFESEQVRQIFRIESDFATFILIAGISPD